jgi:hypothetical protein
MTRILCAASLAAALGCGMTTTTTTDLQGSARIDALFSVPATSVTCVRLVASGMMKSVQKDFAVSGGQSTVSLDMHGIPTGTVMFSGNAYADACGTVTLSSVPSWMADDVTVAVTPGTTASVQLNFRANGNATVQGNFIPDAFTVTTLASGLGGPQAVAFDGGGTLYVADRSAAGMTIRTVNVTDGGVDVIAGSATALGTADGDGAAARFSLLQGVALSGSTLYIADACAIRAMSITTPFTVSTVLGTPAAGGATWDCSIEPRSILDIAVHGNDLYVTDPARFVVSKVTPGTSGNPATVTTVAGTAAMSGATDGAPASFLGPQAIVFPEDTTDNFLVADQGTLDGTSFFGLVRRVSGSSVSTLAGTDQMGAMMDGLRRNAFLPLPRRMVSDGISVFIADLNAVRRYDLATGAVVTIAGNGTTSGNLNGVGSAARLSNTSGIARNASTKALYVADTGNRSIRVLTP